MHCRIQPDQTTAALLTPIRYSPNTDTFIYSPTTDMVKYFWKNDDIKLQPNHWRQSLTAQLLTHWTTAWLLTLLKYTWSLMTFNHSWITDTFQVHLDSDDIKLQPNYWHISNKPSSDDIKLQPNYWHISNTPGLLMILNYSRTTDTFQIHLDFWWH